MPLRSLPKEGGKTLHQGHKDWRETLAEVWAAVSHLLWVVVCHHPHITWRIHQKSFSLVRRFRVSQTWKQHKARLRKRCEKWASEKMTFLLVEMRKRPSIMVRTMVGRVSDSLHQLIFGCSLYCQRVSAICGLSAQQFVISKTWSVNLQTFSLSKTSMPNRRANHR